MKAIYYLKMKEIEQVIVVSLLKSFVAIVILHIINFLIHLFKSLPIDSVGFSAGGFFISMRKV